MTENVKEFLQKLDQEEALRKKFMSPQNAQEMASVIQEAGFSFSPEVFREKMKELQQEAGIEKLTDDALDGVEGGVYCNVMDGCDPNCRPGGCQPTCVPLKPCAPVCAPNRCHPCNPLCNPVYNCNPNFQSCYPDQ